MANQNPQKGSQSHQQPQQKGSQQPSPSDKGHKPGDRMNERTERSEQSSTTQKTNTQRK